MTTRFSKLREKYFEVIFSDFFRTSLLICGFLALILARLNARSFALSLESLYITLISLAACWYGVRGGFVAATLASLIFLLEANYFANWAFRDIAIRSAYTRLIVYYIAGIAVGYYFEVDKRLREKLNKMAYFDELTGCINYRWTMDLLEKEFLRCKRYNREMTVVMIDIDHFKQINDNNGHSVGNEVLKTFANVIRSNVRSIDIAGRYGGDEFFIILPESGSENALVVLERIRTKLSQVRVIASAVKEKTSIPLNFSAGVAAYPYCGDDANDLVNAADNALYQVKRTGRNKIAVERRRWIRERPVPGLRIEFLDPKNNSTFKVLDILNISKQGMLLVVPESISKEKYLCKIFLPKDKDPTEIIPCEIIHRQKINENSSRVGVYFTESVNFSADLSVDKSADTGIAERPSLTEGKSISRFQ